MCVCVYLYTCFCVCTLAPMVPSRGIKAAAYSAPSPAVGCVGRGGAAERLGRGQNAVNFSSDRKRAEKGGKKKNDWPFCREEWGSGVYMTKMPVTG